MNKSQALYNFWSSFGLEAYDQFTVPTGSGLPDFPYITYEVSEDEIDYPVLLTASLWYSGTSWEAVEAKAQQNAERIKRMNAIKLDNGYMTITSASPFARRMDDPNDGGIRRIVLNVTVEYFTEY